MWRSNFTYFGPTSGSTCARMHYYTVSRFCVLRVMYQNKWIPKFQLSCSYSLFSLKFLTLPNVQNGRFSLKSWRTTATLKCNNSRTIWDRALKLCMVIHFIKAFQMTLTLNMSLEVLILLGTTYLHIHNNGTSCSDHELVLRFQKSCSELFDVLLLKPLRSN